MKNIYIDMVTMKIEVDDEVTEEAEPKRHEEVRIDSARKTTR